VNYKGNELFPNALFHKGFKNFYADNSEIIFVNYWDYKSGFNVPFSMISILMPVKNAANYLEECLESILNQTMEDWELIMVDDHSTDSSALIMQKYADSDERIHLCQSSGTGIIPALTEAYKMSDGKFISRMDADDIMELNKLELLSQKLKNDPSSIVTAKVKYFAENSVGDGYLKYENWLNSLIDNQSHYNEIYKECVLPSPCWMMERETLDSLGGFESLGYPEDYDLCFKAYQKKINLIGINQVLHFWRDYNERTSRNDPNYSDNRFIPLKVTYFLETDLHPDKELILWGAGKKGKAIAQLLIAQEIPFNWISNNENKIGHNLYGLIIQAEKNVSKNPSQLIIAVANPEEQDEIRKKINQMNKVSTFWFC